MQTARRAAHMARRRCFVVGTGLLIVAVSAFAAFADPARAADTPPMLTTNAGLTVTATPAVSGRKLNFSGTGFAANEQISLWVTSPDRQVIPLDGAQADGYGSFAAAYTAPTDGTWLVTAHGLTSKKEVVTRYLIGATTAEAATVPASNGISTTASGTPVAIVGQAVTISGQGMNTNEEISLWTTAPDGKVLALPSTQAERNGSFSARITFTSGGYWQVTAKGRDSGRETVRGFTVSDVPPTPTATVAGLPTAAPQATPTLANLAPPVAPQTTATADTGAGQQFVTPNPAQLTPPAIPPQP